MVREIGVDQADLQQVQRQHVQLLVFLPVARQLPALAEEDEPVGAVPILCHVQPFLNLAAGVVAEFPRSMLSKAEGLS